MTPSLALPGSLTAPAIDAPPGRRSGLRLLRSAGVRFAVVYALLLALSAAALALFLWLATAGLLDRLLELAGWTLPWDRGRVVEITADGFALPIADPLS